MGNRVVLILPTLRLASPVCVGPFKDPKFADSQLVDLEGAEPRSANDQTPNDHAADRKRADGHCSNGRRSHRKRQQSCGGRNVPLPGYFAHHKYLPFNLASVR